MPAAGLRRLLWRARLADPDYAFLFRPGPPGEVVALDCEATGLDPARDDIVAIAAVPIRGSRILLSQRFEALVRPEALEAAPAAIKVHGLRRRDVADARPMRAVLPALLRTIGGRPILGYYIDFDLRLLDRHARALIGTPLPNPRIEVSALYFDRRYADAPPGTPCDLRFATMLRDLRLPVAGRHDALGDAVMAALAWLVLRDMAARGARLPRGG